MATSNLSFCNGSSRSARVQGKRWLCSEAAQCIDLLKAAATGRACGNPTLLKSRQGASGADKLHKRDICRHVSKDRNAAAPSDCLSVAQSTLWH